MLYSKRCIDKQINEMTEWQQSAYNHFSAMMMDQEHPYPCVPGKQGFLSDTLRFGFAGDPRQESTSVEVASLLKQYGKISRQTGDYASLVVFFDSRFISDGEGTVDNYEKCFWTLLNKIHELDEKPWPTLSRLICTSIHGNFASRASLILPSVPPGTYASKESAFPQFSHRFSAPLGV